MGEAYREEDYRSAVRVLSKEFMNTQSEKKKFDEIEFFADIEFFEDAERLDGEKLIEKQRGRAASYFSKLQKIDFANEVAI